MKNLIKKIFNNYKKIIIIIVIATVSIILISLIWHRLIILTDNSQYKNNSEDEIITLKIRKIYDNIENVSCSGAWYIEEITDEKNNITINELKNNELLDYIFSYLDKNNELSDNMNIKTILNVAKKLYAEDVTKIINIENYQYNDFIYNKVGKKIKRKASSCISPIKYVSQLYGYTQNEDILEIDINYGYTEDDKLYDLSGKLLGEYDDDDKITSNLLKSNYYYRYNYKLIKNEYKLSSIELVKKK